MAIQIDSGEGGDDVVMSEINVTPLVDVMLVLLVIFMVTAPLINPSGVPVQLPKAAGGTIKENPEALWVTINAKGVVHVENRALTEQEFNEKFTEIIKARDPKDVYLRADENVKYGVVAKAMAEIQAAGVARVGMVTETPPNKRGKRRR